MTRLFHPFLALIASSTDRELARYIEYLKAENKILRARIPRQVHTKPAERKRLLKLGKVLGKAIEELIGIVTPVTFYRRVRDESDEPRKKRPKGGRRKPQEVRDLVIEIAKQTGLGYTRIIGELRKMGIKKISWQTVRPPDVFGRLADLDDKSLNRMIATLDSKGSNSSRKTK